MKNRNLRVYTYNKYTNKYTYEENRGFLMTVECQRLAGKCEGSARVEKLSLCNCQLKDLFRQESFTDAKLREKLCWGAR